MFYTALAKVVLIFGSYTQVLLAAMDRKVEGTQKGLSDTDRGEASAADSRRDMGDAQVGISSGSSNNSVVDDLHRDMTGNRGTVGGTADNI